MTDFAEQLKALKISGQPFAIATVIAVRGSASAKPGSKALINHHGKNVWGWVGGGCAESFVARNALEAIELKQTRIVQADLDDEIFGLGMPCGGVMDVFIDPQTPPETITVASSVETHESVRHLAESMGFHAEFSEKKPLAGASANEALLHALGTAIGAARSASRLPLRETRGVYPANRDENKFWLDGENEFLIMGSSRITEELARFGALARWPVRVYGWNLDPQLYPASTRLQTAAPGYTDLEVKRGSIVMVASHHKGDHEFIQAALESDANYVGLIASEKRSKLLFKHLSEQGLSPERLRRIHAPAGLDFGCRGPSEIALSCMSEIIESKLSRTGRIQ